MRLIIWILTILNFLIQFIQTNYTFSIDSINDTSISPYITNGRLNIVKYKINDAESVYLKRTNDSASIGSFYNISMPTESLSSSINNIQILDKNETLTLGKDYEIYVDTSNSQVLPDDLITTDVIFGSLNSTNNTLNNTLNCIYNFGQITYDNYTSKILNSNLTKIISVGNFNFAIGNNTKGIKAINAFNGSYFEYKTLDDIIIGKGNGFINNITIQNIWVYNGFYIRGANLIVQSADSSFYIYNITNDGGYIEFHTKTDPLIVVNDTIAQVAIYENSLLIAYNNSGLVIYSTSNNTWSYKQYTKFNNLTLSFSDMIVNYKTAYLIVPNYGMVILNLLNYTFSVGLEHPYLQYFDYTVDPSLDEYQTYFIGIIVKTNKDFYISEFLIELIVDAEDEYNPLINKAFTSNEYTYLAYVGTDLYGYSYFFSAEDQEIIVIIRSQQNYLNGYSYSLDLSDILPSDSNVTSMTIINGNRYFLPNLIFRLDNDMTVDITNIKEIPAVLSCNITKDKDYRVYFTSYNECSKLVNNHLQTLACPINYFASIDVEDGDDNDTKSSNLSALWAILAILLVGVIIVIVFVVCCKRVCVKGANQPINRQEMYVISENREKDNIDIQVDIR